MWTAILITVVASTGNNIGKALQKSATASLPRLTLDSVVLYRYLSSREWVTGLAADLGGGLLMIAAVARAPVCVCANLQYETYPSCSLLIHSRQPTVQNLIICLLHACRCPLCSQSLA